MPEAPLPSPAVLRVLVIGQAPRRELEEQIALAVPGLRIAMEGALDGMTRQEIARDAAPQGNADTLFTVLPSGETTTISKAVVTARLAEKLQHGGPTLLCCTGSFQGLPQRADLVQPSAVLNALSAALLPRGRLGIFLPLPEQLAPLGAKRAREGLETVLRSLRPLSDEATVDAAAREMAAQKPDLVLLDCMSYTRADKERMARHLDCPILLSIATAARAAACLLPE
ncbi:AroM family protein [Roseomonas sp. E05]|uniref:AroM family protein n=1 Tax=Roseomonas sp. E05 TaxID=3046310 RepID=UPI0024B8848F|nr:AroM family protein [Roseomonas sp. E05]MDJ0388818.1 AroM family protein [Roseomonas sp. E05]